VCYTLAVRGSEIPRELLLSNVESIPLARVTQDE